MRNLVLIAGQDKVFPWQGPTRVGEVIPNAQVYVHYGRHDLDEPEKVNQTVNRFPHGAQAAAS